jgi:hypothetical protein
MEAADFCPPLLVFAVFGLKRSTFPQFSKLRGLTG